MEDMEYPKLVRDRIPEIVKKQGKTAETRVAANTDEFLGFLGAKLIEESNEFIEAHDREHQIEELADVYEVLRALASTLGIEPEEIQRAQDAKREERGGFEDRIVMLSQP